MPVTYEPIATNTLSSAASSITFSSIPATYTDLRVVFTGTGTTSVGIKARFNNDSNDNYSYTEMLGNGGGAFSGRQANLTYFALDTQFNLSTTIPTIRTLDIFSYANSTFKTTLVQQHNNLNTSGNTIVMSHLWRSTSAINEISLLVFSSTIAAGSTATLYGIKNA
jgi:hypothetical protein